MSTNFATIEVQDWLQGPLHVADTDVAHANKQGLDAHLQAEWSGDLDATMRTVHPDEPWQIVHGLGFEIRGYEAVREYYAARFESWPGPGMEYFTRVTVTDTCAYLECQLAIEAGEEFAGLPAHGAKLDVPAVIIVDFRDSLVLGETAYLDSALAREQLSGSSSNSRLDGPTAS